jgi:hypothetical protein
MDKDKRGPILHADHCWELPQLQGDRLSGWADCHVKCYPRDWCLTLYVQKAPATGHLSATGGPWKLRLISQLVVYKSPGFVVSRTYKKRDLWLDCCFIPQRFPCQLISRLASFPMFLSHCPVITALVWACSSQTYEQDGAEISPSLGALFEWLTHRIWVHNKILLYVTGFWVFFFF